MSKDKLTDYSATAASNTDIGGVDIDEGMLPSNVNNALREQMSHLADFAAGTTGINVLNLQDDDASASIKIQAPATVTATTTLTLPDGDGSASQSLTTNGSGALSWSTRIGNVVEDTTPQLGGNLDVNGNDITGTGDINLTGTVTADGLTVDTTGIVYSGGNVGIGTSSPAKTLDVDGQLRIRNGGATGYGLLEYGASSTATNNWHVGSEGDGSFRFYNGNFGAGSERMRITSGGNVGIGTSSPVTQLHIQNSSGNSEAILGQYGTGTRLQTGAFSNLATIRAYNGTNDALAFWTGSSEKMRINSSGNVGIGTTAPSGNLHVNSASNALLTVTGNLAGIIRTLDNGSATDEKQWDLINDGGNVVWRFVNDANTATASIYNAIRIGNTTARHEWYVGTNSEAMRIDSSGRLLVNRTVASNNGLIELDYAPLTVKDKGIVLNNSNGTTGGQACLFLFNGAGVGNITTTPSSTAYNTSSDYRLKENITEVTGAADRVKALNPVRFNFIADPDKTVDGFLAHEVQDIVPEAITGTKDAMRDEDYEVTPAVLDDDGNVVTEAVMGTRSVPDYQGIDQSKLVPLLTAALQEALTKIDDLETRLAALEAN